MSLQTLPHLYKWIYHEKKTGVCEFLVLSACDELEKEGRATRSGIADRKLATRTLTYIHMQTIIKKGLVTSIKSKDPYVADSLHITLKGRLLLNKANKILDGTLKKRSIR